MRDPLSGPVQQASLRCSAGSVRWLFPRLALRLLLKPNVASARPAALCIKASRASRGATVYAERAGELQLLMEDGERPEQVHCVRTDGARGAAIFLQANPQSEFRRRAVSFRYELLQEKSIASKGKNRDRPSGHSLLTNIAGFTLQPEVISSAGPPLAVFV